MFDELRVFHLDPYFVSLKELDNVSLMGIPFKEANTVWLKQRLYPSQVTRLICIYIIPPSNFDNRIYNSHPYKELIFNRKASLYALEISYPKALIFSSWAAMSPEPEPRKGIIKREPSQVKVE